VLKRIVDVEFNNGGGVEWNLLSEFSSSLVFTNPHRENRCGLDVLISLELFRAVSFNLRRVKSPYDVAKLYSSFPLNWRIIFTIRAGNMGS